MDSSGNGHDYSKHKKDYEDYEISDKQKERVGRSRKLGTNGEDESEGSNRGVKRKCSSKATTDGDNYNLRSKQGAKKRQKERT